MVQRIIFYFSKKQGGDFSLPLYNPSFQQNFWNFRRRQVRYAAEEEYALGRW